MLLAFNPVPTLKSLITAIVSRNQGISAGSITTQWQQKCSKQVIPSDANAALAAKQLKKKVSKVFRTKGKSSTVHQSFTKFRPLQNIRGAGLRKYTCITEGMLGNTACMDTSCKLQWIAECCKGNADEMLLHTALPSIIFLCRLGSTSLLDSSTHVGAVAPTRTSMASFVREGGARALTLLVSRLLTPLALPLCRYCLWCTYAKHAHPPICTMAPVTTVVHCWGRRNQLHTYVFCYPL